MCRTVYFVVWLMVQKLDFYHHPQSPPTGMPLWSQVNKNVSYFFLKVEYCYQSSHFNLFKTICLKFILFVVILGDFFLKCPKMVWFEGSARPFWPWPEWVKPQLESNPKFLNANPGKQQHEFWSLFIFWRQAKEQFQWSLNSWGILSLIISWRL